MYVINMKVCAFFLAAVIVSTLGRQRPSYAWKRLDEDTGPNNEGSGYSGEGSGYSGEGSGFSGEGSGYENRPTSRPGSNSKHSASGSKEEMKCNLAFYKTILQDFRAFPSGVGTELTGYDPITYDPILDDFWAEKEDNGLDTALEDLGAKFVRRLLHDRYQCRATQFNQILVSILENRTDNFIAEKMTQLMSNFTVFLKKIPNVDQARLTILENRTDNFIAEKMTQLMSNFTVFLKKIPNVDQARLSELPNEIIKMINRTMHNTIMTYLEDEEFEGVSCFMEDVEERLREVIENGETLEDVKDDVKEYASEYLDIFTCTKPSRILEIYRKGWNLLTRPRGERNIMVHLKRALKNILAKGDDDWARGRIVHVLVKFVHRFIIGVVKPLRPIIDIRTKQGMLDFLRIYLPTEKLTFAEQLIESIWNSLGYMTPPPTQSPAWTNAPSTPFPSAPPSASPNANVSLRISNRDKPSTKAPPKPAKQPATPNPKPSNNPKTGAPSTGQPSDTTPSPAPPSAKPPSNAQPSGQKPPNAPPSEKATTEAVSNSLYQRLYHLEKMRRQMIQRRRNLRRMQEYADNTYSYYS